MNIKQKKILLPGNFSNNPDEMERIIKDASESAESATSAIAAVYEGLTANETTLTVGRTPRADMVGETDIIGVFKDSYYCKKQNSDGTYSLVLPSEFKEVTDYSIIERVSFTETVEVAGQGPKNLLGQSYQPVYQCSASIFIGDGSTHALSSIIADLAVEGRYSYNAIQPGTFFGFFGQLCTQIDGPGHVYSRTTVPLPLSNLEAQEAIASANMMNATIDGEYNYYAEQYEAAITPGRQEVAGDLSGEFTISDANRDRLLPCFSLELIAREDPVYSSPGGPVFGDEIKANTLRKSTKKEFAARNRGSMNNAQYFNNVWVPAWASINGQSITDAPSGNSNELNSIYGDPLNTHFAVNTHAKRMSKIVFSEHHLDILKDPDNKIENYPFFVDIKFDTDQTTKLADVFSEMGYLDTLVDYTAARGDTAKPKQKIVEGITTWDYKLSESGPVLDSIRENVVVPKRTVMELEEFLNYMDGEIASGQRIDDKELHGGFRVKTETTSMGNSACDTLKNRIYSLILKGKLTNYMKDNIPTDFQDIIEDSTMQTSDTIMYRIDKRNGDDPNSEVIAQYFFPNTSKIDTLRYIDTQVIPDQIYTYTIYAYQIVPTVRYRYGKAELTLPASDDSGTGGMMLTKRNQMLIDDASSDSSESALVIWQDGTNFYDVATAEESGGEEFVSDLSESLGLTIDSIEAYGISGTTNIGAAFVTGENFNLQSIVQSSFVEKMITDGEADEGFSGMREPLEITTDVYISPSLRLVATPIYAQSVRVLSSPPLAPTPTIAPYKDANDSFHLVLENCVGKMDADPIEIFPRDRELFNRQKEAQRLVPGQQLEFENDDRPSHFEVYRTKKHPTEWADFKNNLLFIMDTSILTDEEKSTGKLYKSDRYAYAAASKEEIDANVKYYYMFRTVDVHGFVSNPSEIYCVELVDNDGSTYLLVDVVDFVPKVPKISTRRFGRHLKIAPRITQTMIDNQAYTSAWDAVNNQMDLGVDEYSVWGKKFKFVIKSLKSGREVHLKADFAKTHNRTERESSDE